MPFPLPSPDPKDQQIIDLQRQLKAEKAMLAIANSRLDAIELDRYRVIQEHNNLKRYYAIADAALVECNKRSLGYKLQLQDTEERLKAMFEGPEHGGIL